jgi:hypothetical protein
MITLLYRSFVHNTVVTRLIRRVRMDSGITFIMYTHSQEIGKANNYLGVSISIRNNKT